MMNPVVTGPTVALYSNIVVPRIPYIWERPQPWCRLAGAPQRMPRVWVSLSLTVQTILWTRPCLLSVDTAKMVQIDWPQARQDSSSNIQEMTWLQWITEVYVVPKSVLKQELKMLANKLYILYTHLLLRLRNMCLSLRQQKRACLLLRSKIGCHGYDSERKVLQYEEEVSQPEEMPVDLLNWEDMVSASGMGRPTLCTLIERDELRATVWGDMFRYTVFREQVHDEYDSKVFGGAINGCWDEITLLS